MKLSKKKILAREIIILLSLVFILGMLFILAQFIAETNNTHNYFASQYRLELITNLNKNLPSSEQHSTVSIDYITNDSFEENYSEYYVQPKTDYSHIRYDATLIYNFILITLLIIVYPIRFIIWLLKWSIKTLKEK
jgi:predicted PurR-regulated permease PerM